MDGDKLPQQGESRIGDFHEVFTMGYYARHSDLRKMIVVRAPRNGLTESRATPTLTDYVTLQFVDPHSAQ